MKTPKNTQPNSIRAASMPHGCGDWCGIKLLKINAVRSVRATCAHVMRTPAAWRAQARMPRAREAALPAQPHDRSRARTTFHYFFERKKEWMTAGTGLCGVCAVRGASPLQISSVRDRLHPLRKKSVTGFDIPNERGMGRNDTARLAAFFIAPPVLAARMGGRKARRFASAFAGMSTRSSRRHRLTSLASVVAKPNERRPTMAVSSRALAPVLSVVDGTPTTLSTDVARHFGRQHLHVMEKIRAVLPALPESRQSDFRLAEYTDGQGKPRPAYRLTRDGFTLLAMGFTGKRALQFKLAYIDAFNRMEADLAAPRKRYTNADGISVQAHFVLPDGRLNVPSHMSAGEYLSQCYSEAWAALIDAQQEAA